MTYKKSHNILDVLESERKFNWNRKELESLFSYLSIDSIENFFETPNIIRDDLWRGLRSVDIKTFQFDGGEKDLIVKFVEGLDKFCYMRYEQTPSKSWKFEPLDEKEQTEPYNYEKEREEINSLFSKAKKLKSLFDEVKKVLTKYSVNVKESSAMALARYEKAIEDDFNLIS